MKCPVAGHPIEEIKWERANRELPDDLRQKVLLDGTLVISSVQKKDDAGVYTCSARNKQGHSARRSGDVAVIGKASFSTSYSTVVAGDRTSRTSSPNLNPTILRPTMREEPRRARQEVKYRKIDPRQSVKEKL